MNDVKWWQKTKKISMKMYALVVLISFHGNENLLITDKHTVAGLSKTDVNIFNILTVEMLLIFS